MNEKKERLIFDVTYQPQVRTVRDTQRIMLDVIVATLPIVGFGVYRFGWHVLLLVVSSMAAAVFFEWAYRRLLKKSITRDFLWFIQRMYFLRQTSKSKLANSLS